MKTTRGRGRYFIAPAILLAHVLLAWCPSAFALDPALDVSQYAHTAWKIREGFTKGTIHSLAQTPDGYLWLGTDFGLLRFDGVRAVPWQPPIDQQLTSNHVISLVATRDGTLWIGTANGLDSCKDGKLTHYGEFAGHYVFALLEDREGTLWVGTTALPIGKLAAIRNGIVQWYGADGSFGRGVDCLYEDSRGNLWVGVAKGLWRWKPGPPKFYQLPGELNLLGVGEDDGTLLIGTDAVIKGLSDDKVIEHLLPGLAQKVAAKRFLRDRDGGMWIATSNGLLHVHQGRTDLFTQSDSLSSNSVQCLFEDREGTIWVSTGNGLDRFRDLAVTTFASPNPWSVLADRDGSVWFGGHEGLNRWNKGQLTIAGDKPEARLNGVAPHSLFQDHRGRMWVSTQHGLGYLENNELNYINGFPGGVVRSMAEDAQGDLWIGTQDSGLWQLSQGSVGQQIPWGRLGHKDFATVLIADATQGGLWLGFIQGGIAYLADGQIRTSYESTDGLGAGIVNDLRLDQDGTLWVATDGGLSRLRNGRIVTLNSKDGLPCDSVHWLVEDDAHSFWLLTECGLVRIARAEFDAWTVALEKNKSAHRTIQTTVFDSSDGVKSHVSAGGFRPHVAKSADGKIWFLPWDGVSFVDPNHLPYNRLPPPVHIEQLVADRKTYDATYDPKQHLRLPPLIRDLQIDYTALSLAAPEKDRFRYMLEGKDRDWQDVGNRRQAFYNDLPPGNYRFRVMACNNSGVWNEAGTYLDFTIDPAYYQTTWFRVFVVAAFLVLLGVLYQLRVQQVARQVRVRMEERLDERERIARDLHDTLLQSTQGLILKIHAVAKQIPREATAHDALEKVLDRADQVLAEGRDRVRNLRDTTISLSDLPAGFKRVAEETSHNHQATFKTVVEGRTRELHPLVLEESYRIGREALINALKHSQGRLVEVEITYEPGQFRLRVRDDGRGIDPRILAEGGRADHWGMQGMRERADRIGAELKIWSGHQNGTEVELIVPSGTAYKSANREPRSRWFRKQI